MSTLRVQTLALVASVAMAIATLVPTAAGASRPVPGPVLRAGHPTPRPASAKDAGDWLGEINRYREAAGLASVTEESSWTEGIRNHLVYLANTPASYMTGEYASAHTENPDSPYYTPSGDTEARSSDLTFGGGYTPLQAIDGWLAAPFHAIGMLRAQLRRVAFANDASNGYAGLDVIQGIDYGQPAADGPVLFPGPGMTTDLSSYQGNESPSPLETCGWQGRGTVGLPIIALLPTAPAEGISAELTHEEGSTATSGDGDLCVVDENTYSSSDGVYGPTGRAILQGDHAVLVIPAEPLADGSHTVTIHQPGRDDISWSFTEDSGVVHAPTSQTAPSITGIAEIGQTLTAGTGTWSGDPTGYAYAWQRCDAAGEACVDVRPPTPRPMPSQTTTPTTPCASP